jgi:hypothetical protein
VFLKRADTQFLAHWVAGSLRSPSEGATEGWLKLWSLVSFSNCWASLSSLSGNCLKADLMGSLFAMVIVCFCWENTKNQSSEALPFAGGKLQIWSTCMYKQQQLLNTIQLHVT